MPVNWQIAEAKLAGVDRFSDAAHVMPTQLARAENVRIVRPGGVVPRTGFALIDYLLLVLPYVKLGANLMDSPLRLVNRGGEVIAFGVDVAATYTGPTDILPLASPTWGPARWAEKGRTSPGLLEGLEVAAQSEAESLYIPTITGGLRSNVVTPFAGNLKFPDVASNGASYLTVWTEQVPRSNGENEPLWYHPVHWRLRNVHTDATFFESQVGTITHGADRSDGVAAKCIAVGTTYAIAVVPFNFTNEIYLYPISALGAPGAPVGTGARYGWGSYQAGGATATWDICEAPGLGGFWLVYSDTALGMTIEFRDNLTLAVVQSLVLPAEHPVTALTVYYQEASTSLWVAYTHDAGAHLETRVLCVQGSPLPVAMGLRGGFPAIVPGSISNIAGGRPAHHCGIVEVSPTLIVLATDEFDPFDVADVGTMHHRTSWRTVSTAAAFGVEGSCGADMWLASRPWVDPTGAALVAVHHDDIENGIRDTGYVYRIYDPRRSWPIPGGGGAGTEVHFAGETAAVYHQGESDTPVRPSRPIYAISGGVAAWSHVYNTQFDIAAGADNPVNALSHVANLGGAMPCWAATRTLSFRAIEEIPGVERFNAISTAIDLIRLNYLDLQAFNTAEFGSIVFVAGPVPQIYDGVRLFEFPFQTAGPELRALSSVPLNSGVDYTGKGCVVVTATVIPDPIGALSGTYTYAACWRYTDARGNVYRSAPSQFVSRTVAPPNVVIISAPPMPAGRLLEGLPDVQDPLHTLPSAMSMEIYRSEANLSDLHLLGEVTPTDRVDATFPAPGNGAFRDDGNGLGIDAAVATQPALYTQGGEIANEPPPACKHVCAHRDRLWLATGGRRVWFSKLRVEGRGPEFSSALVLEMPEAIHAVASLDSSVVAFGESGMYLIVGEGPDNNGAGSPFSYQRLPGNVTCHAHASIISTPAGVMFVACRRVIGHPVNGLYLHEYETDGFYSVTRSFEVKKIGPLQSEFHGPTGEEPGPVVVNGACRSGATEVLWLAVVQPFGGLGASTAYVYDWALDQWFTWSIGALAGLTSICEGVTRQEDGLSLRRLMACSPPSYFYADGFTFDGFVDDKRQIQVALEGLTRAGAISGYQRARKFLVHARPTGNLAIPPARVEVSFAFGTAAERDDAGFTEFHTSTSRQIRSFGFPLEFRFARQKDSVIRWRIATLIGRTPALATSLPEPLVGLAGRVIIVTVDGGTPRAVTLTAATSALAIGTHINLFLADAGIAVDTGVVAGRITIATESEGPSSSIAFAGDAGALAILGFVTVAGAEVAVLPPTIYGVGIEVGVKRGVVKLSVAQRVE